MAVVVAVVYMQGFDKGLGGIEHFDTVELNGHAVYLGGPC